MSAPKIRPALIAIALPKPEAASALGMGVTAFDTHVAPDVRVIRCGALRLYPIAELQRWADENAAFTLVQQHRAA